MMDVLLLALWMLWHLVSSQSVRTWTLRMLLKMPGLQCRLRKTGLECHRLEIQSALVAESKYTPKGVGTLTLQLKLSRVVTRYYADNNVMLTIIVPDNSLFK